MSRYIQFQYDVHMILHGISSNFGDTMRNAMGSPVQHGGGAQQDESKKCPLQDAKTSDSQPSSKVKDRADTRRPCRICCTIVPVDGVKWLELWVVVQGKLYELIVVFQFKFCARSAAEMFYILFNSSYAPGSSYLRCRRLLAFDTSPDSVAEKEIALSTSAGLHHGCSL